MDTVRPEDLTARARIRDAALVEFADRGFKGATMKSIADAAGVSVGLVQHHFGSKDALREACDGHVLDLLLGQAGQIVSGELTDAASADLMAAVAQSGGPLVKYVARALADGTPLATTLFDQGADLTEEFLTRNWPDRFPKGDPRTRTRAATLAAMKTGVLVLHGHLSRRLGYDVLDREHAVRLSMAVAEVFAVMGEWLESETGRRIREAGEEHLHE